MLLNWLQYIWILQMDDNLLLVIKCRKQFKKEIYHFVVIREYFSFVLSSFCCNKWWWLEISKTINIIRVRGVHRSICDIWYIIIVTLSVVIKLIAIYICILQMDNNSLHVIKAESNSRKDVSPCWNQRLLLFSFK